MMFSSEPNRSKPAHYAWFSVSTPGVFKEHRLPGCEGDWSAADRRKYRELEAIAERHRTHVVHSTWRRG